MEVKYSNFEDPSSMESMMKRSLLAKNKLAIIIKGPDREQFCCVQCPVRCEDKEQLEKHLYIHNNVYRYLCGICGTGMHVDIDNGPYLNKGPDTTFRHELKRKEHLERHTLEHQQVRPHVCEVCCKAFKRKEHLNIHRSIHSGDKTEVCMLCQKSFYRKDHLQKHLQTHSKMLLENSIPLTDQELIGMKAEVMEIDASDRFDDSSQDQDLGIEEIEISPDQQLFIASTPSNEDRPHACHLCEKTYKRKDHLKLHLLTHDKKDKICSECGEGFSTDEKLLHHMSMHLHAYSVMQGDDDKSQLQALLAEHNIDSSFLQPENSLLVPRISIPVAVEGSERRHQCDVCGRKFKRRQHLVVHRNVHIKNQPNIWCARCRQGFHSSQTFETHNCNQPEDMVEQFLDIKIEHPPAIEEELDIQIVNPPLDAKKENEWPHHIKILPLEKQEDETQYVIQDESDIPTPQRVYVCKFCSKPFKRKDHYKIHLHIHTGVKSFFCPDCGKGFYRKDHLQKHSLVHAKAKPQPKPKKALPDLFPINKLPKKSDDRGTNSIRKEIKPEITIHAPSNTKLRVPLQIKVPYQMVMSMDNGEQRAITVDPHASTQTIVGT